MDEGVVTRMGGLDMQVCVPKGWSDIEIVEFAEKQYVCGTAGGWSIRRQGSKLLGGHPERQACADRYGFVHVILDA